MDVLVKRGDLMMLDSQEWLHTELIKVEAWEKDQGDLWFGRNR